MAYVSTEKESAERVAVSKNEKLQSKRKKSTLFSEKETKQIDVNLSIL